MPWISQFIAMEVPSSPLKISSRGKGFHEDFCATETCFPNDSKVMFVFRKVVSGKPLSKLSCVYFPLEKLVNGKHFPVKKKFGLVFKKVFSPLAVFVFRKVVSGKSLSKLSRVCLPLEKLVNGKHFLVKGKFGLVFRKVFS